MLNIAPKIQEIAFPRLKILKSAVSRRELGNHRDLFIKKSRRYLQLGEEVDLNQAVLRYHARFETIKTGLLTKVIFAMLKIIYCELKIFVKAVEFLQNKWNVFRLHQNRSIIYISAIKRYNSSLYQIIHNTFSNSVH